MTEKLYIYGPPDNGEGPYFLMASDGEVLYSHFCSGIRYAEGDLVGHRANRQADLTERFGDYTVVYAGGAELSREELLRRNQAREARLDEAEESPRP